MKKSAVCLLPIAAFALSAAAGEYAITSPKMGSVHPTGGFWAAREATNRLVTAEANLKNSYDSGRVGNFIEAGKLLRGEPHGRFVGIFFNDSDVYKAVEGVAYTLSYVPNAAREAEIDKLISIFGGAQEEDGYIYTARTLGDTHERIGDCRWYCDDAHELYCMGHLIEAAVAYHDATGKDAFLKIACRAADMMRRTFGFKKGQIKFLPGHEEIELALVKLYRKTGNKEYLQLSKDLLDMRGLPFEVRKGGVKRGFQDNRAYYQDHLPVRQQKEAVGHSVRAGYLYSAMCDVGVLTDDKGLLSAVDAIWKDITERKLYLSGGVGARPEIEGFGPAFDLPNDRVCLETCAAIANALFNERLFRRTGDAKYLDLVERIAYNGSLCSSSIGGDEFFYPNPMASRGGYGRSKWFGCACCPPNVVRFVPQLVNWTYAINARANAYYWNFFASTKADLGRVVFEQQTDYPWSGEATLVVTPKEEVERFTLNIRIPGWARGIPAPGGLYHQTEPSKLDEVACSVNGESVEMKLNENGFLSINRLWKAGDTVKLTMPMSVKRIVADERIEQDRGRTAVERGPLVYCAEGVDNGGKAFNAILPKEATFDLSSVTIAATPMVALKSGDLTLVPFFAWCHRGAGEMQTWFAESREIAAGNPAGILVTASHTCGTDTPNALFDGKLPTSSADESIPRFTFWPHRGTSEWIQMELPVRKMIKGLEVYWFDDRHAHKGDCGVPATWTVQTREFPGLPFTDLKGVTYTSVTNGFSKATFEKPVDVEALRIAVQSAKDLSSGILEARLIESK